MHWITRIVSEELVGINTGMGYEYNSSKQAILALWGCQDPSLRIEDPCVHDGNYHVHVISEVWNSEEARLAEETMTRRHPSRRPIDMGSVGYAGTASTYLQERVVQHAFRDAYLPLEYYKTYSNPGVRFADFFDSPWSIAVDRFKSCRQVPAFGGDSIRNYLSVTADRVGVVEIPGGSGNLSAKCVKDVWWVSPTCRSNLSECIPVITGGDGWYLSNIMQLVFAWKVPAAVALAQEPEFFRLPLEYRMIFYNYSPGGDFRSQRVMLWPPPDNRKLRQGILTTATSDMTIRRFWVAAMRPEQSSGSDRRLDKLAAVFHRMSLTSQNMEEELIPAILDHGRTHEAAVCEWLNNNSAEVDKWMPSDTECLQGQGLVDATGAFVTNFTTATDCKWCPAGRKSVQEGGWRRSFRKSPDLFDAKVPVQCRECEAGEYQDQPGASECRKCYSGSFAEVPGSTVCARCPLGKYSYREGVPLCHSCSHGFITSTLGATSADECICPTGMYADPFMPGRCQKCIIGMKCEKGSDMAGYYMAPTPWRRPVPNLLPGFWSSAEDPLNVFRCNNDLRCPGGRAGNACGPFLMEQACALCMDGYYWDIEDCRVCVNRSPLMWGIPLLGTVLAIVVLYRLYGDPYEKWSSWQNGFSGTCFIVMNHHQMLIVIKGCNVVFPRELERMIFFEIKPLLGRINLHPGCIGMADFGAEIVAQSVGPLVVALLCVLTFHLSQFLGKLRPDIRMDKNRMINGFLSFLFTFFTGITEAAITMFMCSENPNGSSSLIRARNITCYEQQWKRLAAIGSVGGSVWILGFSSILVRSIYLAPQRFHIRENQMRWKFLFIRYRPDVHWWALVVVAKGIILGVGISIFSSGVVQLLWICSLHIVYLFLLLIFRPWRHMLNNTADAVSKMVLILNIAVFATLIEDRSRLGDDEPGKEAKVLALVLIFMTFLPILPTLAGMIYLQHSRQVKARKELSTELMLDSLQILLETEPVDVKAWIARLGERDFLLMSEFKDLVQTELGGRMCRPGYSPNCLRRLTVNHIEERQTGNHLTGKKPKSFFPRGESAGSDSKALSHWSDRSRMHCASFEEARIPTWTQSRGPRRGDFSAAGKDECAPSSQQGPAMEGAQGAWEGGAAWPPPGSQDAAQEDTDTFSQPLELPSDQADRPTLFDWARKDGEGDMPALSTILKDIEDSGAMHRVRAVCNQVPQSPRLSSRLPYVQHAISQIGWAPPEQMDSICHANV